MEKVSARSQTACLLLVLLGACLRPAGDGGGRYDVILRGGSIVDGSGNPRYVGDVAISGDRIAAVGYLRSAKASETLDVRGLVVAPGFIDMLGQSEGNVLIDNRVLSKVTQGVTTEITGEGGSVAPLTDLLVVRLRVDEEVRRPGGLARSERLLRAPRAH